MDEKSDQQRPVQLELSQDTLRRLLKQRNLVASEVNYLNDDSFEAGRQALKKSLLS